VEEAPVEIPRGLRAARVAILPLVLALALVAVLLLGRDDAAGKPVTTKLGTTTQGREFKLGVDSHGRVAAFSTQVAALCPTGRFVEVPWDPTDGDPAPFERDGDRVRVREVGEDYELELDGTVDSRGGMRGRMSLVVHVTPRTKPAYDCRSKNLRFFAGA
jgi:hypothetical protein